MDWLSDSWDGNEELWKLVWIYGALFVFLGYVLCTAIRLLTDISIDSPASAAGIFVSIIEVTYCVWMLVSLWRCAFNVQWSIWGYCARFAVIAFVLLFCSLSYKAQKLLLPEEMIAKADAGLQTQVTKVLNPTPAQPAQKKKPNFTIKVNRI